MNRTSMPGLAVVTTLLVLSAAGLAGEGPTSPVRDAPVPEDLGVVRWFAETGG